MRRKMTTETDEITAEINYDAETGLFTWNKRKQGRRKKIAGSISANGYMKVMINGREYLGHRLAWFLIHGEWPDQIDHINGIRSDNRLCNLRNVNITENNRNKAKQKRNSSGVTGVYKHGTAPGWYASIIVDKEYKWLGYFTNFDDAVKARKEGEVRYGFHENHGRED